MSLHSTRCGGCLANFTPKEREQKYHNRACYLKNGTSKEVHSIGTLSWDTIPKKTVAEVFTGVVGGFIFLIGGTYIVSSILYATFHILF